jgi:hypothetical protein
MRLQIHNFKVAHIESSGCELRKSKANAIQLKASGARQPNALPRPLSQKVRCEKPALESRSQGRPAFQRASPGNEIMQPTRKNYYKDFSSN